VALLPKRRPRSSVLDAPAGVKIVLHVGCGAPDPDKVPEQFQGSSWRELRLDIDPDVEPDIVGTIVDMSAVPPESVDAVWSSHNLEHVYAHEVPVVLREFQRVLRSGGEALILVPDLQKAAEAIATGNLEGTFYTAQVGPVAALDVVYGFGSAIAGGNEYMAHRTGFTAKTLERKLCGAGFGQVKVERRRIALLLASARKPG
jgi:SAM-dependent methyltransferase